MVSWKCLLFEALLSAYEEFRLVVVGRSLGMEACRLLYERQYVAVSRSTISQLLRTRGGCLLDAPGKANCGGRPPAPPGPPRPPGPPGPGMPGFGPFAASAAQELVMESMTDCAWSWPISARLGEKLPD